MSNTYKIWVQIEEVDDDNDHYENVTEPDQLLETARQLTASLNQTDVLTKIAHEANSMMRAHGCVIYLLEADKKTLKPVVAIDPSPLPGRFTNIFVPWEKQWN